MTVGYARASTADQDSDKEAPAQQLHGASEKTVRRITDPFGASHSPVRGHFARVLAGATA